MEHDSIELSFKSNLDTFECFVTTIVDSLKSGVTQLRENNTYLDRRLEFSQAKLDELKQKCMSLEFQFTDVKEVSTTIPSLENRMRTTEAWTRRKNLRVSGLAEETNKTNEQTLHPVRRLAYEKLVVPNVKVAKVYRGNRNSSYINPWQFIGQLMS